MASESMHVVPRRFSMNKRVASALGSEPEVLLSEERGGCCSSGRRGGMSVRGESTTEAGTSSVRYNGSAAPSCGLSDATHAFLSAADHRTAPRREGASVGPLLSERWAGSRKERR